MTVPSYALERRTLTAGEWKAEGTRLFGADLMTWRFVCPSCGHVATPLDWLRVGAAEGEWAFACVGRHIEGASTLGGLPPCNYTGGGLFKLNPITVFSKVDGRTSSFFAFERTDETEQIARGESP